MYHSRRTRLRGIRRERVVRRSDGESERRRGRRNGEKEGESIEQKKKTAGHVAAVEGETPSEHSNRTVDCARA